MRCSGFALVATLLLLILLVVISVGLLNLSTVTLRQSSQDSAMVEARANARMALMLAIGELQKEVGPDMRVTAESAIFDSDKNTESIQGVDQAHWLASYNSWGDWLNATYTLPGVVDPLTIADTYTPRRERMFRRWLLSLPKTSENDITAPNSIAAWNDSNSVILVGAGSLGASVDANQITRAYLKSVGDTGKYAWWIGPENQKARVDKAKRPRALGVDEWQVAQGDTAEVGIGSLDGFEVVDVNPTLSDRFITTQTLRAAQVTKGKVQQHFYDLTAHSQGVVTSVRTGSLKKDLSLLFEMSNASLPDLYKYKAGTIQEPSIRPMSPELLAKNPKIPNRHFASWTNMRHFYRMYRSGSDANSGGIAGTGTAIPGSGSLQWSGSKPYTDVVCRSRQDNYATWNGSNNYLRFPIIAKVTFIYSLQTEPAGIVSGQMTYYLNFVYTPVFTFWNPYNTEIVVPSGALRALSSAYQVLPLRMRFFLNNTVSSLNDGYGGNNINNFMRSASGAPIVFKPGELKVFSNTVYGGAFDQNMTPGFNPLGINGGDKLRINNTRYTPAQNPGFALFFGRPGASFNINNGNTPGSLALVQDWTLAVPGRMPIMYQHDWFQKAQQFTPITLDPRPTPDAVGGIAGVPQNIERWVFDGIPQPIAYAQLVIKGASPFSHDSIAASNPAPNNWRQDWRSRNWIQAPPFYTGSSMYISENTSIAHTQRMDNPYIMNFGPLSNLGEAVALVDPFRDTSRAALGSGSNAAERVGNVPAAELPTAPVGSLAGFSGMRINSGWADASKLNPKLRMGTLNGLGASTIEASLYCAETKAIAYQSGVTGPGIGNSFMHPVLSRNDVYQYLDNSKSQDPVWRSQMDPNNPAHVFQENDNMIFNDYWDHVFLLNDALWDDYFVSSLADQTRPGATAANSLSENFDSLVANGGAANSRYHFNPAGHTAAEAKAELQAATGYLKAAKYLIVDGMFNVNSTSVAAWQALFAGIRERRLVYRDGNGALQKIELPSGKRIAISRFETEVSNEEVEDPASGVTSPDGWPGWSGVRFLDDKQLRKLAEECVKQVKQRGPFLNFSEFINRRLSNDDLGTMGALQCAIDYDDKSPDPQSINYRFKEDSDHMIKTIDLGTNSYKTPEAAVGSRFAGIPGYVIQSDILKPIANTLSVRDDTFLIRAYGEKLDGSGKVLARAWCEAIVQRIPEYCDPTNEESVPARVMSANGVFSDNNQLTATNLRFGRKLQIKSFRWLNTTEI